VSAARLVVLSLHTSPLATPGTGDGGGMNVYVRALAASLARAGLPCDVVTRAEAPGLDPIVELEPGVRVVHLQVGPPNPIPKHDLAGCTDALTAEVLGLVERRVLAPELIHANYWLSGAVGHKLKHALDVPLAATFHTLARVKAEAGVDDEPDLRTRIEHEVIDCADLVLASTPGERAQLADLYGADPERIEIVPPGVDHGIFSPGDRLAARRRLGIDAERVLLFAGRIQRLKGADLAVRALACLDDPGAHLLVVGGPSGPDGPTTFAALRGLVASLDLEEQVHFLPAQPHERLADHYRAADVCVVPSRSESFGLVALEAAASGVPVVAAAVGGLRSLVVDGETGFLVEGREPCHFAAPISRLLADEELRAELGRSAWARSWRYSWSTTAARFRRLYADLTARGPVLCAS
jgi:D-inositol-3-phosphate glycosyltransferase